MLKLRLNSVKRLILFFLILTCNIIFSNDVQAQNGKKITSVVIDAGHGGKDPGAVGKKSKEKDITLKVAKMTGDYIKQNCPDVKVIYTRSSDVFVSLLRRAQIANEKNADRVEDNAVTVMSFENGAIAINETGFCSNCSPIVFEVHGEKGYVRMEDDYAVPRVVKRTQATGGKPVEVALAPNQDLPIIQFVKGEILPGCGLDEAEALTHMMVMAYGR